MSLPETDAVRLRHMLDAANEALTFSTGRTREELDSDSLLRSAVIHQITVLGEAASKVSPETREAMPEVPWRSIVGMRNRIVHAYFQIDNGILWRSVQRQMPPLVTQLRAALFC